MLQKNYLSFLIYTNIIWEHVWEWILWILRIWDNSERYIKLDQVKFIDVGPLNRIFI